MTSSKSFRASLLPSAFSFSAPRTNSDPDGRSGKLPRRASSLDPLRQLYLRQPAALVPLQTPDTVREEAAFASPRYKDAGPPQQEPARPPPSTQMRRKSKNWGARVSSLLPPLISHHADSNDQSVPRKPTLTPPTGPATLAPSLPPPPPPPPYSAHESTPVLPSDGLAARALPEHVRSSPTPPSEDLRPQPTPMVFLPKLSTAEPSPSSYARPHVMAPIPPSPETQHAALASREPAAVAGPHGGAADTLSQLPRPARLQKEMSDSRRRSLSLQHPQLPEHRASLVPGAASPMTEQRGRRSASAQTPSIAEPARSSLRLSPVPPGAPSPSAAKDGSQSPSRGRLRRSWLPGGGRSRSNSTEVQSANKSYAWVMSEEAAQVEYNPSFLKNAEKVFSSPARHGACRECLASTNNTHRQVPELWNESGTVLVYLYPRASGCGPSFKVPEFTVSSSYVFNELIQTELESLSDTRDRTRSFGGRSNLSVDDATRVASSSPSPPLPDSPGCMRLYLPTAPPAASGQLAALGRSSDAELDRLIAVRNLFAFLTGQPLVATQARPSTFQAFLGIAELLQEFGFSGMSGDGFGEAVDLSFGFYSEQLGFADCRHSREKTIEALVLGERMRSLDLYNEAFAHAAGKYSAIMELRLPLWDQVTPLTRQQLERAHLDLVNRQHNVNEQLEQFEFPSLFAGIANSSSFPELKAVRFKVWRNSFNKMRAFLLGYYKSTFGSWPPKASSKKNPFAESGLNRLVLKVLYSDMCALYDLLVDRNNLTSRVMDEVPAISNEAGKMTMSALRNIMSEFDRSKPPVLPPVPFDLPLSPSMTAIHETFNSLSAKDQNRFEKKIKEHELLLILNKAYNYDTNSIKLPFLDQFKDFEMREGKGKMCQDLVDQRIGYWIFLYVVLQSLPMLVVDAPDLTYTEGVEYFLCEPPMGSPPWVEDRQVRKMWYEIAGAGGRRVELSADAVMFSVEGTYHRSHCWLAAKQWEGAEGAGAPPPEEPAMSPLEPPRAMFQGAEALVASPPSIGGGPGTPSPPPGSASPGLRPRNLSPGLNRASSAWRSSIAMGLEPIPMNPPNIFGSHNRSSSLGPRPPSSHIGSRSVSTGNLVGMSMSRSSTPSSHRAPMGATFDDILGGGDPQKKPAKATKKKGRFF